MTRSQDDQSLCFAAYKTLCAYVEDIGHQQGHKKVNDEQETYRVDRTYTGVFSCQVSFRLTQPSLSRRDDIAFAAFVWLRNDKMMVML